MATAAKTYKPTPCFDQASFEMFQDLESVPEFIRDAAKHLPGGVRKLEAHEDASETLVFARQLETIKNRLYEKKYAELKGRKLVPFSNEAGLETEYLTYRLWDGVTLAVLVTNYAMDFPLVTASGQEFTVKYHEYGNAYGFSLIDLRKAAKAGVELQSRYAMLARRGHELVMDDEVAFGVPQLKTFGIANHPNVPLITLPNGTWASASGLDILEDMNHLVTEMFNNSLEIWQGDTMVMSTLAFRKIATTLLDTANGSNITVLEAFLKQNPGINVSSWTRLSTANAAGTNGRILFYKRDPEVMEFEVGREFEIFPPEQKGLMISYPCISKAAGVSLHHPLAVAYADNQLM